ncbi:MAG: hypothetical protein JWN14_4386 [Chthonomonadales bacterium]|nr:hypothetical protein [Chthonomonadales bacterium]
MRISVKDQEEDAPVTVTAAGRETLVLRAFVRQAIPMLDNPDSYPCWQRRQLAASLTEALEGRISNEEEDAPPHGDADVPQDDEYEPGMDWP